MAAVKEENFDIDNRFLKSSQESRKKNIYDQLEQMNTSIMSFHTDIEDKLN